MRIAKHDIPRKLDVPGATARQLGAFGEPSTHGALAAEYLSLAAGTDIAPLLEGLEDDACQSPHWGYVISGCAVATFTDGSTETCSTGDMFHWPPGHSVRVVDDAELVLFSPEAEHAAVFEHMREKLGT